MLWHKNGSSFSKLQTIEISDCKELRCVFPSNIATSLVFLDTLKIYGCELLEMIFEIEKQKTSGDTKVVPLRYLSLGFLKNLKYVWDKDVDDVVAFPNLKKVKVGRCPKLKIIFPASFTKYMKEIEELEMVEPFNYEIFPVDEASKLKEVIHTSCHQCLYVGKNCICFNLILINFYYVNLQRILLLHFFFWWSQIYICMWILKK